MKAGAIQMVNSVNVATLPLCVLERRLLLYVLKEPFAVYEAPVINDSIVQSSRMVLITLAHLNNMMFPAISKLHQLVLFFIQSFHVFLQPITCKLSNLAQPASTPAPTQPQISGSNHTLQKPQRMPFHEVTETWSFIPHHHHQCLSPWERLLHLGSTYSSDGLPRPSASLLGLITKESVWFCNCPYTYVLFCIDCTF